MATENPKYRVHPSINPYWDEISASGKYRYEGSYENFATESIKRYSVIQTIIMEENRLFASREQTDIEGDEQTIWSVIPMLPPGFDHFILSRKWTDFFSGGLFALIPELILKYFGAVIVDLNVNAKQKAKASDASFLHSITWALTSVLNACIAQPLFFIANIILHARALADGLITTVASFFIDKKTIINTETNKPYITATVGLIFNPKAIWSGVKGVLRGLACLVVDALAISTVVGITALCSLAFQPHLAMGIMPIMVGLQSTIMGAVSAPALVAAISTAGVCSAIVSQSNQAITHHSLSSTHSCLNALSTQPNMNKSNKPCYDEREPQRPLAALPSTVNYNVALTSSFGFRPYNSSHFPEPDCIYQVGSPYNGRT